MIKIFKLILLLVTLFLSPSSLAQKKPIPVFVSEVKLVEFTDKIEALGTLEANENVNLVANVTERITAINFEDNQQVKKGDILVEMDSAEEEAQLLEEKYRRDEAMRQVNRLRPLVKRGAASALTLDEKQSELNASNSRMKAIQSRINERKIIAPFDGVVGIRNVSVGDMAFPGIGQSEALITTIDDNSIMKLNFSVPEIFLSTLKKGLTIEAKSSAYPERIFKGQISSVGNRVNPITRSVMARALLKNEENLLKSGMLMRVKLNKNPRKSLVIPEEAIITVGKEKLVMVVQEKKPTTVKRQTVKIGTRKKGKVEILSGLEEGQKIVTHGTLKVRNGSEIIIKAIEKNNEKLTELLKQKNRRSE